LDGIMVCVYSNQNEIVNNYCHDNGWDGIIVAWGSEENTVAGNNCSLNGRSGITLVGWYAVYGGACNNDVIENNCTGNGSWGIAVRYWSDDNVVESNLCKNNGYGIYTVLASSNTFFHNLILYNDLQVYDEYSESGNYWYSPALLEGNVWSDYIGVDFDHDGIGDTDVPWPEEGFDPYPLVTGDFDNDGLSYYAEIIIGTDPENPDSDFDGFSDADEWRLYFTEPLTPNEPQDATEVIVADIQDLVDSGDLKQGTANSMLKKIEGAVVLMERGNYHAASQKLGDFIDQVSALVVSGRLSAEEGEALIELAQGIVNVLNAT
jgi:parallel beta-helix repeat protein